MPGIELSTDMGGVDCHLLALGLRWQDTGWQSFLTSQREGRLGRLERMLAILAAEDVPISGDRVLEIAGESSVGRPHVARTLVEAGHATSVADAFNRWLGNGMVADVPREKLTPAEAIGRVHDLGGIVSIAHPPFMGEDYADRVRMLRSAGADAVETFYKHYPTDIVATLLALCEETGALASGGSDYHGLGNPEDRPVGAFAFDEVHLDRFIAHCEDYCTIPWIEEAPVA
jgi:predicted metal-dependent phosphoesterase TrpH